MPSSVKRPLVYMSGTSGKMEFSEEFVFMQQPFNKSIFFLFHFFFSIYDSTSSEK